MASLFSDNVFVGDTSTPTIYEVSDTLSPNISQYGWTKSDLGHVNQLIGYVDSCKEYYETVSIIGEYTKQALAELTRIEGLTLYINDESSKNERLSDQIAADTKQAGIHNANTATMHRAIQLMVDEVRKKYDEIVAIGIAADKDADSAKADATLAADYYLRTKTMYDEWKAANP